MWTSNTNLTIRVFHLISKIFHLSLFILVNCLTQRPCPWCPWRGFPKSNVQCRMSNEVQWSPMTDKEYQIFISALSARYWRSGETLYNVQTAPKLQKCLKLTTFHISQHLTVAPSIVVWIFAFLTEGIHYITKAWSKIWSCLSIREAPRKNYTFHLIIFYRPPKRPL